MVFYLTNPPFTLLAWFLTDQQLFNCLTTNLLLNYILETQHEKIIDYDGSNTNSLSTAQCFCILCDRRYKSPKQIPRSGLSKLYNILPINLDS